MVQGRSTDCLDSVNRYISTSDPVGLTSDNECGFQASDMAFCVLRKAKRIYWCMRVKEHTCEIQASWISDYWGFIRDLWDFPFFSLKSSIILTNLFGPTSLKSLDFKYTEFLWYRPHLLRTLSPCPQGLPWWLGKPTEHLSLQAATSIFPFFP